MAKTVTESYFYIVHFQLLQIRYFFYLLTYFRKGKLQKFFKCDKHGADEVDFFTAAEILSCRKNQKRMPVGKDFYDFLDSNKIVFDDATDETLYEPEMRGRDTATAILKILNSLQEAIPFLVFNS